MAEKQLTLPGEIVKKSNELARAKWPITSDYEPRLVALVACRVRPDDEDLKAYYIPISDILGQEPGSKNRHRLKAIVKALMSKPLVIKRPGGGWAFYNVFVKCAYTPGDEYVEVQFHPDMLPHYLGLSNKFTKYSIIEYLSIPSGFSKRLFEVLRSWDDKKEITIPLDELRGMVGLDDKAMTRWVDFKRYVLDRGKKHISAKTGMVFDFYPQKQGRAVCAVRFVFDRESRKIAAQEEGQKSNEKKVEALKNAYRCWKEKGGKCKSKSKKLQCQLCRENYLLA